MPSPKILLFCLLIGTAPLGVVVFANYEQIADSMVIEASEAEGKLLFFTAPSR